MDRINLDSKLAANATVRLPVANKLAQGTSASREEDSKSAVNASQEELEQAVSAIEGYTQSISRNLNFSLDDSTGRVVVKVTDGSSGEVIRQIPSEDALKLAESLDQVRSLLFKAQA